MGVEDGVVLTFARARPKPPGEGRGTRRVRCYPNCYRKRWVDAGKKRTKNDRAFKMCPQTGRLWDAGGRVEIVVLEFADCCVTTPPRGRAGMGSFA